VERAIDLFFIFVRDPGCSSFALFPRCSNKNKILDGDTLCTSLLLIHMKTLQHSPNLIGASVSLRKPFRNSAISFVTC
jgi:hypothetical protein